MKSVVITDQTASVFPFDLHWDAQQLTDAAPLRLFEAIDFQALHYGQCDASVNDARMRVDRLQTYLPRAASPSFRVR